MTNFDNLTPNTTAFVDSDNNVQDLEQVLTSGAVIVTASASGPIVPVGTEVTPLFENITPWAGKFVDESNNIVDLLQFLTSGAIQVQVVGGGGGGGAPTNATYITQTSDLVALPNSIPLSSMVSGLLSSTTGTGALRAVTLSGTANQLVVTNGTGVAGNPTVSLSPTLVFPGTATLGGNLEVAGYTITQTGGLGILTMSAPVSIDLVTPWVTVNGIRHYTDSGNKILFGTQLVQLLPNNTLQLEANASGVRLFSGPAVNSISTDGTLSSNSDSTLATQKATKTYVDTNQNALKAATFITATNETAMLPNSTALSGLPNGFAMVYSGLLETQILTGTANQINIAGGDASLTAPVFSLSSTLVTPGTLDVGTTFSVGGTGSITSITTNPASVSANALMPASTVQAAISAAITAGTSFRGGWSAAGGLYPTTGGSGPAGAVAAGDWWYITVGGTLNTTPVNAGDQIFALVATPGQTDANWLAVGEHVSSVFGRNGAVVATSGDYSFSLISGTAAYTQGGTGLTASGTSGNLLTSTGSGWVSAAPVIPSVFGRTGAITAATNDYSFSQISGTAAVSQGGTGITAPGIAGNVLTSDGAGNWISATPTAGGVTSVFGRTGAVVATSGDYSFSLISGTAATTQGGTGLASYTTGDLLYSSASNVLSKLAIGSTGNVLTVAAGNVSWAAPAVASVFGRTGTVVATGGDYSFSQISGTAAVSQGGTGITAPGVAGNVLTSDGAGNWTSAAPSAGSVTSVFGRTGAVVATSGDYAFSQISGTAAVTQGGTGLTSTTINQLLYSSAANTIAGLATANNAILGTDATGVPGFVGASPSQGQIIIATVAGVWTKSTTTYPEGNATAGKLLRASGTGFLPTSWTVPNTFGINNMVYASGSNTLAAITPVNSAIMRSSATGVPGWSATLTDGQILIGSTGATPAAATLTQGTGITITNGAGAITITNSDGGSAVTLTNAGTTSLVNDGTGPALATKGLVAGAGMAAFGVSGTDVTINLTIPVVETSGGTNQTTYTKGDILHASAANTLAKLAIGSTGNVLTVSGGDTVWAAPAVSSVFGRTGAVVATSGDYSFSLISGTAVETQGGTNQTTYATGDMLYASAANTLSKLTVGAAGKFLSVAGGVPVWSNATLPATAPSAGKLLRSDGTNWLSSTATYPDTVTAGDLLYASASNTVSSLAVGSTGQVLTVVAGAPAWAAATGGGLTFNTVTASTQAMAVNNTYYSTYAGTCVMTLPASAAVGSIIEIITDTSHLIQIAQNSGQSIRCGALNGVSQVTTTGTGGSVTTVDPNTVIAIKCIVTDTTWTVIYANNNSYSGV